MEPANEELYDWWWNVNCYERRTASTV